MRKLALPERPGWRSEAERLGFTFADMHGEPYWDETSAYEFSLAEVESRIEDPATDLHALCREAVGRIVTDESLMSRMGLPRAHWDLVADSWDAAQPEVYGRMDLAYDGSGPAKLLEYNADTPTSLYESASFQWLWLEQQIAAGVLHSGDDQFNGIHEALVERWGAILPADTDVHFAAMKDTPEDYATVEAMAWAAREAGLGAHYTDLESIGLSDRGQFTDAEDRVIGTLFKLYPWEDLLRDPFADHIAGAQVQMIEPAWKALVSNKAILPVLWQIAPGHPNLLPAFFLDDVAEALTGRGVSVAPGFADVADRLKRGHVVKPIFSREGASVQIIENGTPTETAPNRDYDDQPMIVQEYAPLPVMDGFRPIIGAWIVGETCAGMGIREDASRITQDLSRFKPHFIRD
ncbi:MAG: glutathionylspermidine synthase family protein [Paracoccus sp. (in: a-proteobacteria)]|uniref:glutathionylspermidine synthase family protein n=1 Tax=Paracoccus sp. TaxID=267 RepID=UPI0026E00CB4|nr:glutathionylspermidine synthase family protein [Paracoccus sp. (in: a-proteobacteria)]MDO5612038.1 glutathionylspermidine synthase family protein [Paracoccus sp. (in: a-proteobacteria)]